MPMAVPVMMAPSPVVVAVVPAPMTMVPAAVMAVTPVHLYRLELVDLIARGHGRSDVLLAANLAGAGDAVGVETLRHERSGDRDRRERGGAGRQT